MLPNCISNWMNQIYILTQLEISCCSNAHQHWYCQTFKFLTNLKGAICFLTPLFKGCVILLTIFRSLRHWECIFVHDMWRVQFYFLYGCPIPNVPYMESPYFSTDLPCHICHISSVHPYINPFICPLFFYSSPIILNLDI